MKSYYETLFNGVESSDGYNETFLNEIRDKIQDRNNYNSDINITDLNCDISQTEVEEAVFRSKLGKSVGIDEIPSEFWRNDICINLLHKVI